MPASVEKAAVLCGSCSRKSLGFEAAQDCVYQYTGMGGQMYCTAVVDRRTPAVYAAAYSLQQAMLCLTRLV